MHYSSLYSFNDFVKKYLSSYKDKKLRILDVGSMSINNASTYKRYVKNPLWEYVGLDIAEGDNVDVVATDLYKYPFEDNSFDVVVSGSTIEHIEDIYAWIKELTRITNNLVWVLAPNTYKEHKHPLDCWRVFPDGMRFLLGNVAGLEVLSSEISTLDKKDTIGIAKKVSD